MYVCMYIFLALSSVSLLSTRDHPTREISLGTASFTVESLDSQEENDIWTTKAVPNRLDTRTNQNNSLVISTPRLDSSRWIHCSWIIIEVRNGPPWNLCSVAGNRFYYSNKVRSPCTGRMAHCSFFIKNERRRNNVSFSFVKIF